VKSLVRRQCRGCARTDRATPWNAKFTFQLKLSLK
jgi:hypothetical protein